MPRAWLLPLAPVLAEPTVTTSPTWITGPPYASSTERTEPGSYVSVRSRAPVLDRTVTSPFSSAAITRPVPKLGPAASRRTGESRVTRKSLAPSAPTYVTVLPTAYGTPSCVPTPRTIAGGSPVSADANARRRGERRVGVAGQGWELG